MKELNLRLRERETENLDNMTNETVAAFKELVPKLTSLIALNLELAKFTSDQTEVFFNSILSSPFLPNLVCLVAKQSLDLSRDKEVNSLIDIMNATPQLAALYIHWQTGSREVTFETKTGFLGFNRQWIAVDKTTGQKILQKPFKRAKIIEFIL